MLCKHTIAAISPLAAIRAPAIDSDWLTDCRWRLIRDSFAAAAAAAVLINVLQSVNALPLLLRHCTSYFFFIEPMHYCIHYLLDRRARHFTVHVVYNVLLTSIISFRPFFLFIDLCFCRVLSRHLLGGNFPPNLATSPQEFLASSDFLDNCFWVGEFNCAVKEPW